MGRRRPRVRAHTAALVAVALALVACSSSGGAARAVVGKRAPTFVGPRLFGEGTVRLADGRGTVVLVNFFASWCTPCRTELPLLQSAAGQKGVSVVGVLFNDSPAAARSFLRELRVTFPTVNDDGSIAKAYGISMKPGLPVTYAVGPSGTLVARHIGQLRAEDVPYLIRRAAGR